MGPDHKQHRYTIDRQDVTEEQFEVLLHGLTRVKTLFCERVGKGGTDAYEASDSKGRVYRVLEGSGDEANSSSINLVSPRPDLDTIVQQYFKEHALVEDDFTREAHATDGGAVQLALHWKKRSVSQRGGDGHSRTLLIDLQAGKVAGVVWPR